MYATDMMDLVDELPGERFGSVLVEAMSASN
jgi:hypothetical protein